MKVTTETPEPGMAALTIEVPPEDVERAVDQAWRRLAGRINIPGFRRGKAPRAVVVRHAGPAAIDEETLRRLLPERYDAAVDQVNITPIDRPSFDVLQMEAGKPLIFKATVPLMPEVTLGEYDSLEVERPLITVDNEAVSRTIERLREDQARWEPVEDRGVEQGDQLIATVTLDFPAHEEWPENTSTRQDTEIVIGDNGFPDGFDAALLGAQAGETRTATLEWSMGRPPAAAEGEEPPPARMRPVNISVEVKDIKRKVLPELDDAFAQSVGEYPNVDALNLAVRRSHLSEAQRSAQVAFENRCVDAAIEKTGYEIADRLIELETDSLAREREASFSSQGIMLERYLEILQQSREDWLVEIRQQTLRQLKARLLLDKIAAQEKIEVSQAEIETEIERTAQAYGNRAVEVRRSLRRDNGPQRVATSLRRHKAIERLVGAGGGYPDVDPVLLDALVTPALPSGESGESEAASDTSDTSATAGTADA